MGNIIITFKGKSKVYTQTRNLYVWLSKQQLLVNTISWLPDLLRRGKPGQS